MRRNKSHPVTHTLFICHRRVGRIGIDLAIIALIIVGEQRQWFTWCTDDWRGHFMRLCPDCFLTVQPGDRPGFGNGDRDGAPDDGLHGTSIPRLWCQ